MRTIETLQIHLANSCNLTCEGCSHYSNQGHKGITPLAEAGRWMKLWNERLQPRIFTLLGGEPTIHPQLSEFIQLAHEHWPRSQLRLITNGFFLHRHPELPAVLSATNTQVCLSVHHKAPEYLEKLLPAMRLLVGWVRKYGVQVEYYKSYENWTRRYKGHGADMEPFSDGQPRLSWERCPARYCRQLFRGQVWKCSPLAYLRLQDEKYHLSEKWKPYLDYRPLEADCTEAELNAFFDREEEPSCNMCPANPERFDIPNPLPAHAATARSELQIVNR